MGPELPEGLKVWYEYTTTTKSPQGRRLIDDKYPHVRRQVTAHVVNAETREEIVTGVAVCNPRDQFRKDLGRVKSLGRALSHLVEL